MKVTYLLGALILIALVLAGLYWIKTKLNINLNIGGDKHFPQVLEESTKGLIKCTWFANPHHCDCYKK